MKNSVIIGVVVLVVVVGAASFYGGMKYQQSQRGAQFAGRNGATQAGVGANRGFGNGQRPVNGQIIAADNDSITVKLADGSSKIVVVSGSTQINKAASGSKTDLQNGTMVAVFGTTNSDGTVTAQNIQLNPTMRGSGSTPSASTR